MAQDTPTDKRDPEANTISQLKELLFDDESTKIKGLAARLDEVYNRAGTDAQFQTTVAKVIDGALVDAEKEKHDQVSRAMAPLVIKTVKNEFLNSQDELVGVLSPITGQMVKAYVQTAIRNLANEINRKIENNSFILRLRSLFTGRPTAELAISDSQRLLVEEIFLIRRGSGELLERWPNFRALSNSDIHMSGILTAITDFAAHTFQDEGGTIRNFAVDDYTMYLRASPNYLLAAKCTGTSASGIETIIDDEFIGLLERIYTKQRAQIASEKVGDIDTAAAAQTDNNTAHHPIPDLLSETKDNLDKRISDRFDAITAPLPFRPLKVVGYLFLLCLIGLAGWWGYTTYETQRVKSAAIEVITRNNAFDNFPIDIAVGYRGKSLTLSGQAPDKSAATGLSAELTQGLEEFGTKVTNRLFSIPTAKVNVEAILRQAEQRRQLTDISRMTNRANQRLASSLLTLQEIEDTRATEAKESIRLVRADIEQAMRELANFRGLIETQSKQTARPSDLQNPTKDLFGRLARIEKSLFRLLGHRGTNRHQTPPTSTGNPVTAAAHIAAGADQISALSVALASVRESKVSPRQRLQSWMQNNAIFFGNGDEFRSADRASRKIDELVKLIKADRSLIRVVGYTDERGTQSRNDALALRRAERVERELLNRGIPAARLSTIGRAYGPDLSPNPGADSPNRRVEFEIGFIGEKE